MTNHRTTTRVRKPGIGKTLLVAVVTAVATACGLWMIGRLVEQNDTQGRRADQAVQTAVQLCNQVRQLGGACVVNPEELRGEPGAQGPPGPQGLAGSDGRNGVDGINGVNGKDGVAGPPGPQGDKGAKGDTGAAGQAGAPPAGWSWTDGLGFTHICTRDPASPDTAPTYTCTGPP